MNFSDYCKNFYHGQNDTSLQNYRSQPGIVKFFLKNNLSKRTWESFEATDADARKKTNYFNGKSSLGDDMLKEIYKNLSDENHKRDFVLELESELVDPSDNAFLKTVTNFEVKDTDIDKKCFARALAEQLLTIADDKHRNIVPEKYAEFKNEQTGKKNASDNSDTDEADSTVEFSFSNPEIAKKYSLIRNRDLCYLIIIAVVATIAFTIVFIQNIKAKNTKESIDTTKPLNSTFTLIDNYLAWATTDDLKINYAEKLYESSKSSFLQENANIYRLYSAILKLNALDSTYGDQKNRLATQGLNLCQNILDTAEKEPFLYYMAKILQCHFYEALGYSTEDTTWTNDINIVETYLNSYNFDLKKNEDAMLSSYGYNALLKYYGKILSSDYKRGTEELYKKYVDYYDTRNDNLFIVAYITGSELPVFDLEGFSAYSEYLFRLLELNPSKEYQGNLVDIINTCHGHADPFFTANVDYEDVLLTSIKADAYYYRGVIAETEINEYDADFIYNAKSDAENAYRTLLKCDNTDDPRITETIIKSIYRMIKHDLKPYDMNEQIIQFGDLVLRIIPNLYGYSNPDTRQEWIGLICGSCYNILNKGSTSVEFCDLGKRASERITPMDTYDLVITEKDIPIYKKFFENCQKEDDHSFTPEESPNSEQTPEESETSEENK